MRKTLRAVGAAALTTGLVVTGAAAASAHVTVTPDTTEAGSYALLTFGVPHGCGDSPTTKVSVQVPEQVVTVTPTVNPGWDVEKVMEDLAEPVDDGHGGQYTERVAEVVYTAKAPLPDGYRDAFVLSLSFPTRRARRSSSRPCRSAPRARAPGCRSRPTARTARSSTCPPRCSS